VSLAWTDAHHHLAITGPTGVGKTYLGIALGVSAIRAGHLLRYYKLSKLLERVGIARADGTHRSFAASLARTDLLILDDWEISPISPVGSREILDLLDDREEYGRARNRGLLAWGVAASFSLAKGWRALGSCGRACELAG